VSRHPPTPAASTSLAAHSRPSRIADKADNNARGMMIGIVGIHDNQRAIERMGAVVGRRESHASEEDDDDDRRPAERSRYGSGGGGAGGINGGGWSVASAESNDLDGVDAEQTTIESYSTAMMAEGDDSSMGSLSVTGYSSRTCTARQRDTAS
jgi:hypothetical protein